MAFPFDSSISIIDTRSMHLLSFLIPPPPSFTTPFITSLRWSPLPVGTSSPPNPSPTIFSLPPSTTRAALCSLISTSSSPSSGSTSTPNKASKTSPGHRHSSELFICKLLIH
ncbi:hypothetical protein JHK82_019044 [Glycine max]|uniref:WDR11 first beta-propeller domain-containing protein n=1 Tax=Glycine soja TaxID=3848 RepID=A0A0B2QZC6_GLYSO|nr:hypothetical protein JHK87_018915 [Glycine soja]KAG5023144.1 hypothetical protein JHK85_019486 [Glycine max]KAG5038226.1 hypothetical protein JHK86_019066 [Glycine max]KAG5143349.1 hypothetical protein JHK82_019044 [Glycine max]KHN27051.1 hypothetical protein glysoja_042861 [Glycine soja]